MSGRGRWLFIQEAVGGGAVLGVALGWHTFRVMRQIDDYSLNFLITLGLAFVGYKIAVALQILASIMAVCADFLIGDIGSKYGMSEKTRKYVQAFWVLIDEILNAVLFMMTEFEVFAITFETDYLIAGCMAI